MCYQDLSLYALNVARSKMIKVKDHQNQSQDGPRFIIHVAPYFGVEKLLLLLRKHRDRVWCSKFWLCGLILTRLLLFPRIPTFPQNLRNPHATSETAQKLQLTWNSSAFSSLQTFLQTASQEKKKKNKTKNNQPTTNRKVAALLKCLCLSNQSGDSEECCGAAAWKPHAGSHNLGRVIYCEPHLEKRHQGEFKWKEKKNWLMSHRGR